MKSLHIRNLHPATLAALKRLARRHHRSLQGEVQALLEKAASQAPPEEELTSISLVTVKTGKRKAWRREDMYDDSGR